MLVVTKGSKVVEFPRRLEKWALSFLFFLLIYVYIFQPPIVDRVIFLCVWVLFFCVFFIFNIKYIITYLEAFKWEICLGYCVVLLSLARDLVSSEIVYSDRFITWFFQCLVFPAFILCLAEKSFPKLYESENFIIVIYYAVILASALTICLILFPVFDNFYKNIQVDGYYELYKDFKFRYRAYGIAENLNFTYGYILGVFAGYALVRARKNFIHFLFVIMLLIGVSFNARIGYIPVFLSLIFSLLQGFSAIYFFTLIGVALIYILGGEVILSFSENYLAWGLNFFEELAAMLSGSSESSLARIYANMIIVPSELTHVVFGTGVALYGLPEGGSDIGYVLQLNYAGLIFLLLLIVLLIYCSSRLFWYSGYRLWFFYIFTFSVFFLNFKGFLFAATPGARLLFLLYIYYISRARALRGCEK